MKLLIKKREELDGHVRLRVFLVSAQWSPATTSLIDLSHRLIDRLEMDPSMSTTILQCIDSAMDQLSYHVEIHVVHQLGWIPRTVPSLDRKSDSEHAQYSNASHFMYQSLSKTTSHSVVYVSSRKR